MEKRHREIIEHALGLSGKTKPYRNTFVTGEGSNDYQDCLDLVEMGYMKKWGDRGYLVGDLFTVTEKGARAVGSDLPR